MKGFVLVSHFIPEASCVSQILTAAAVAEDIGQEGAARIGVRPWAKCSLGNSERDVQRVVAKQKSKLEIPIEIISCDGTDVPWVSPQSWLQFIVEKGLWPVMAGCALRDFAGARRRWDAFWKSYQQVHPSFGLFDMEGIDLSRTAAFLLHGDEGRTLKKGGMMVTSLQSALGRGYDQKRVCQQRWMAGDAADLQVNFAGHSFTTRYMLSTLPKTFYDEEPEVFHSFLEHVAKACHTLLNVGFTHGGETFRIALLGVKGDAPYLTKAAHFYRSYNTAAKRGEERSEPKGCCPYCLAGTRLCAAEEIATSTPAWLRAVAVKVPWIRQPALIKNLVHDPGDPSHFFKSDIWHVFHLGFGRSWICSVIQLVLPQLPLANLDEKWDHLTDHYLEWCRKNAPYLLSYHDTSGAMGHWRKVALTSNLMQWLVQLLGTVPMQCFPRFTVLVLSCRGNNLPLFQNKGFLFCFHTMPLQIPVLLGGSNGASLCARNSTYFITS